MLARLTERGVADKRGHGGGGRRALTDPNQEDNSDEYCNRTGNPEGVDYAWGSAGIGGGSNDLEYAVHAPTRVPDLEVGTPSVDDATLYTGNRFTLSVTVTNAGDGASEATRLRYYRSTDSTITTSDTAQGSESVIALAASGTSAHDGGMTAPSEAGTYYYGACVDSVTDESDTTNNCSSSVTVTVSEPAPDLALLGMNTSDGVETGKSFRIGVTVQNLGDGRSAATTLRWLQVTTGESDTELETDAIRALNLHQANFETIRLNAPSTPGTYTYKACVDSVAGESVTTNNCRSVSITTTNNLATGAPTISGTAQWARL